MGKKSCFLFLVAALLGCNEKEGDKSISVIPGYNLNEPRQVYELPDELQEISGLAWVDNHTIATVQDEDGVLFLYDLNDKTISAKKKFEGSGDYEGVAVHESDAYVLKSNGTLYLIADYLSEDPATAKLETNMKKKCDAEGVVFDPTNQWILIACKESTTTDTGSTKSIFAYDVETKQLQDEPFIQLDLEAIEDRLFIDTVSTLAFELQKVLIKNDLSTLFKPSGMAIHPTNGNIYMVSAKNKLIVVLDATGTILQVGDFKHHLMHQPEGITFSPNGTLYISNEGKNGKPNILEFSYEDK